MFSFLSQNVDNHRLELKIDSSLFPSIIAMKAAYTFLDRVYFFFHSQEGNLIIQIQPKE